MKICLFFIITTVSLHSVMCSHTRRLTQSELKSTKQTEQINQLKLDIRSLKDQVEYLENMTLFNNNITTHNVNFKAASAIKEAYLYVLSALEKFFDKGSEPSNAIHIANSSVPHFSQNINSTIITVHNHYPN